MNPLAIAIGLVGILVAVIFVIAGIAWYWFVISLLVAIIISMVWWFSTIDFFN